MNTAKISPSLWPGIYERHAAGQTDQQIADWLATLSPAVHASRLDVCRARQRYERQRYLEASLANKESGAQGRRRRAMQDSREQRDERKRRTLGFSLAPVEACTLPERAHLYQLRVLLNLQHAINSDPIMSLPEKARHTVAMAQAMGRIRTEAELQRQVDALESELNETIEALAKERDELELERHQLRLAARPSVAEGSRGGNG